MLSGLSGGEGVLLLLSCSFFISGVFGRLHFGKLHKDLAGSAHTLLPLQALQTDGAYGASRNYLHFGFLGMLSATGCRLVKADRVFSFLRRYVWPTLSAGQTIISSLFFAVLVPFPSVRGLVSSSSFLMNVDFLAALPDTASPTLLVLRLFL